MKSICTLIPLLCFTAAGIAQQSDTGQPKLTVRSTLVMAPVLVTTKEGRVVFDLKADDFLLTDNGVPQLLTLEQDTDSEPLALAIVVETGGAGARHLIDYRELDSILDALIGNLEHRVAVIGFDSMPHLIVPFTPWMTLCALPAIRIRLYTASVSRVPARRSPTKHQSLVARTPVPSTAASVVPAPIPSTKVTTVSRCSTASASLLRPFGWPP